MSEVQLKVKELFEPNHSMAWKYLEKYEYPWEAFKDIKSIILEIGETLDPTEYNKIDEAVWVHKTAKIFKTAYLGSPCIIGPNTEVRQAAFVRGSALVGEGCVVGNSVELKNCIIFDGVQVPHYNYVGDSILGYKSHMGAGSVTSNVKSDKTLVVVKSKDKQIPTNLKKFGAVLGDFVEVGCNSVLNPGTVIGMHSNVYPLSSVRGVIPSYSIFKSGKAVEVVEKK